jgi:hypothetical protein
MNVSRVLAAQNQSEIAQERWTAWTDNGTGIFVRGSVDAPTAGYHARLVPSSPQGRSSDQLLLDLTLQAPNDESAPVITATPAAYSDSQATRAYASVQIFRDGKPIALVPVQTVPAEWLATVKFEKLSASGHTLHVWGFLEAPNAGYRASIQPSSPPGISTEDYLFDAKLTRLPGAWPAETTRINVSYVQHHYKASYKTLTVKSASQSIVTIPIGTLR